MDKWVLGLALLLSQGLSAEEELCRKCVIIREENKTKNFNNGFTYYEDFEKSQDEKEPAKNAEEKK